VSRSTVSHWETDRAAPDGELLARIERWLGALPAAGAEGSLEEMAGEASARRQRRTKQRSASRAVQELVVDLWREAPRSGGVAVLFAANGAPLWAGKARNLRRKLKRLAREPALRSAVRATLLVLKRRQARDQVAELLRRLTAPGL